MTQVLCPSCATTIAPDNFYCANMEKKLHPGGSIFETITFPNIEPWILSPKTFFGNQLQPAMR